MQLERRRRKLGRPARASAQGSRVAGPQPRARPGRGPRQAGAAGRVERRTRPGFCLGTEPGLQVEVERVGNHAGEAAIAVAQQQCVPGHGLRQRQHQAFTVLQQLQSGTPLYALTNWSAETFPVARSRFEFLEQDVSIALPVGGPVDGVLHLASPASPVDYLEHPIPTLKVGALNWSAPGVTPNSNAPAWRR